jgi:hypothetical protein
MMPLIAPALAKVRGGYRGLRRPDVADRERRDIERRGFGLRAGEVSRRCAVARSQHETEAEQPSGFRVGRRQGVATPYIAVTSCVNAKRQ